MVGAVFYLPALFLPSTTWPTHWAPVSASAIVYLGLFITLGAYGLYNFGVSRIPASRATAYAHLIPVIAVLLGWLLLKTAALQCRTAPFARLARVALSHVIWRFWLTREGYLAARALRRRTVPPKRLSQAGACRDRKATVSVQGNRQPLGLALCLRYGLLVPT